MLRRIMQKQKMQREANIAQSQQTLANSTDITLSLENATKSVNIDKDNDLIKTSTKSPIKASTQLLQVQNVNKTIPDPISEPTVSEPTVSNDRTNRNRTIRTRIRIRTEPTVSDSTVIEQAVTEQSEQTVTEQSEPVSEQTVSEKSDSTVIEQTVTEQSEQTVTEQSEQTVTEQSNKR